MVGAISIKAKYEMAPDKMICEYEIEGVIYEEKFIAPNDAAAGIIRASEPVMLEFTGHSFYHRKSVSSRAQVDYDRISNALIITEGGTVKSRPDPGAAEREGPCVYEGMSTILSASRDFSRSYKIRKDEKDVALYLFCSL